MEPRLVKSAVIAIFGFAALTQDALADPSADEIMQKNLLSTKVADSTANSTFRLINASGQERVRETDGETKLIAGTTDNRRFVNFLSPSDIRGTKTLLIEHSAADDDIWIYLPAMKKVRRLVASNKKDSFVGTDFSYGDVIGYKVEDWNHRLVRPEKVDGRDCYVIESTPKRPDIADNTGYSKRIAWLDKESYVALRGEIYDLTGELLKKTAAEDIQQVDAKNNRYQPMKLIGENVQTSHKTIIEFKNFKANVGVGDEVFTTRSLER
jgi:outer membrane lipoprotein-sorting protein